MLLRRSPCLNSSFTALRLFPVRFCCSERTAHRDRTTKRASFRPEPSSTHDWIGPPNPLSNLRPVVYRVPPNESDLQRQLRRLRQETEDWNQDFWTRQNLCFSKEKEAFILSQLKAKGLTLRDEEGRRRALSTEEMAQFYKNFLDRNRTRHADYNKEWYRRNFSITLLMARVALSGLWRSSPPPPDEDQGGLTGLTGGFGPWSRSGSVIRKQR